MKIAYLLENTSLCGGVKVVFEHAQMLSEHGFSVTIFAKGEPPLWYDLRNLKFLSVWRDFADVADALHSFDLVIATFYQQVLELKHASLKLIHFSQGYEADYPFWKEKKNDIEKAYRLPVPKLTISRNVAKVVQERFSQSPCYVPQGIDVRSFPVKEDTIHPVQKVIIVGTWENEIKGIPDAVRGFSLAKKTLPDLFLIRVSTLPLSEEEKTVYTPDEYHTAVNPADMASIYLRADLAVIPSHEGEGFGLPAIEAMACGFPVILTKIHSFLGLGIAKDYAYFVSPSSPNEIAEAIIQVHQRPDLAATLRKRAREVAEGFSLKRTKEHLISAISKLSRHDFSRVQDIDYIYIEREQKEAATEERLLVELSKETFCLGYPYKTIAAEDPFHVSVGDIRNHTDTPYLAISLDNTVFFSKSWIRPLTEALEQGFDLASPVSPDFFEIDMPYYTPLTFNDAAERMTKKHHGQYRQDIPARPYVFLVRKSCLDALPDITLLYDLPKHVKSTFVPASVVHRFGDYYAMKRDDILPYIPYGSKKILDAGCAKGLLGEAIKKQRECEVYGIEINKIAAEEARGRLDAVFCTDIVQAELPFHEDLDAVIFADILEHLIDPRSTLKNARKWLKSDGIVIASIPNAGHYSIVSDLLRGRWDYVPAGLLCITHLRFFTRTSIEELFRKSGYSVITMAPQGWPVHLREDLTQMLSAFLNVKNIGEDVFIPGYYVVAQKSSDHKSF